MINGEDEKGKSKLFIATRSSYHFVLSLPPRSFCTPHVFL